MFGEQMDEIVTEPRAVPWWHWHRRLYDWVIHFADTRHGATALFALSFAESSFFPVPPDVLLGPLTLGAPKKWLRFALSCSLASVLGGILGYCIGFGSWEAIGEWVFAHFAWGLRQRTSRRFKVGMTSGISGLSSCADSPRCRIKCVPFRQVLPASIFLVSFWPRR